MNKTKVIILIILLFISIGVVSYISNPSENKNNTSSSNEEYNKNDLKESTIKNIAFKPQKLYYKDGNSYLSVDIINNNDTAINLGSFKIIVKFYQRKRAHFICVLFLFYLRVIYGDCTHALLWGLQKSMFKGRGKRSVTYAREKYFYTQKKSFQMILFHMKRFDSQNIYL